MALVAYENSDSSDFEEDSRVVKDYEQTHDNKCVRQELDEVETSKSGHDLFNMLPQPSNRKEVTEEDDEFLYKTENICNVKPPKAKITVPSLSDFKDVEETVPNARPKMVGGKKSGLLSMLPQPKNSVFTKTTNNFVPHVLTQKPRKAVANTQTHSLVTKSDKKAKAKESILRDYSDESDNDDIQNDFFSMKKMEETSIAPVDINLNGDDEGADITKPTISKNKNDIFGIDNYLKQDNNQDLNVYGTYEAGDYQKANSSHEIYSSAEASNVNETILDDEAILKLCGTRSKRKREEIQIVDVNQKEVLADAREWMVKGLMDDTTKRVSVSKKRGGEPTTQQRRKHQITYLAHQAKANEAELQNQWANNRMSKRQTQSKYGF